jgi:phenylacetate-CoA ligase
LQALIQSFYHKLPVHIQTALVSIYGYKIDRVRHGKEYAKLVDVIDKQYDFSSDELQKFQSNSLREIIRLCFQHVPYYRNKYKDINGLFEIESINSLKKFPLLEKSELRKNPEDFLNEKHHKKNIFNIHTTGTTGTPLKIYCNSSVRQKNYAFYERFLRHSGIDYKKKRATFGGRIIVASDQQKPPFWRYSYFQNNLLFSSYHLRDENIEYYIKKICQFRPHYIDSYPSSIYAIAKYALEHSIDLKGVTEGITTSAETLFDYQRTIIQKTFGVPIVDQYGAAEMCVFIGQCAQGSYHVHSDYAIVEFLREDGSPAMAGEEAEVVCTGLINTVMPLIRYKIGDRVVVSDKKCTCGCAFPVVEKVIGRTDDVILTPEGNRVGRLSPVLKGFPIKEAQYVQHAIDAVLLRLVPEDRLSADTEQKIVIELRKRLGQTIKIHIEQVESIERGSGGKMKTVISSLSNATY